ncbi:hypothetical protein GCM10011608_10760 [Micromonospora sonchi]|uniref:Uncharacterized protein n=1 Tax=Micromonospora sonchi TaxID=1763543 RepID=A0A917WTG4_9ACTN|nr:hypothetical protein [Micromonospora sonchi]GGM27794.1 hypothetical protein GCM10011608_10760 [Micromonospora sonchi]
MTINQEHTPLREWEPERNERVVHWRDPNTVGTVIRCDRYGHVADPYWRASVRWDGGRVEDGIETSSLTRVDGTQGRR